MAAILTYAVGDIHGSHTKLANLVRHCIDSCGQNSFRFVFLGDYVDRGARSRDVIDFLIELQTSAPDRIVCLRGNHEDMLVDAARRRNVAQWLDNGGDMTLRSYGIAHAGEIPTAHLEWFAALPLAIADETRFFVHAGVMPGVPLQQQPREAVLWIREPFLSDERAHGLFVVHGHTPTRTRKPDLRRNRLNLDTMAWHDGPLTAAVFDEFKPGPLAFITDDGRMTDAPPVTALLRA